MNKFHLFGLLLLFATLLPSCTNQNSPIGLGDISQIGTDFTDTITVSAYSIIEDTINTTNLSGNIVGHLYDPVFGSTVASIYTQLAMSADNVNFGTNPVIDSCIFTLQLASYYGDTNARVGIRIHQLTESLLKEHNYYQNNTVAYDPTPLNYSLTDYAIRPNQEVVVDTAIYSPHIRIPLSNSFGQYLLNHQYEMNHNFSSFLKGLCITAVSHTGTTGYTLLTSMTSSLSGITIYYHNADQTGLRYKIGCSSDGVRFTRYSHDYNASTSASFLQEVVAGDQNEGTSTLYVQGSGGVKTVITFPYLQDAFQSLGNRVVINKAELVIKDLSPDEQYLVHPVNLTLQGIKQDGKITYLPDDDYYTSASYYGGTYDATKHEYRFRITKYVQQLVSGTSPLTNSVNLVVRGSGVRSNRLIIGGTGLSNDQRLRLEISYSTY
ncbi:MAG: DUF4270 domain-containing protein [Bacteroidales bacterium]|nr:DUF4270 domain-containing protein [Bacteroidales bacterium]